MGLYNLIKRLIFPNTYDGKAYINALKKKYHIDIGEGCRIWEPNHTYIDIQRPHLLHIGDNVKITRGVTILAHDYSRSVFTGAGFDNIGEAGKTWIGDNVFIGMNAIILMGSKIEKNSIIGAGSVVSGEFEENSLIVGNPAKRICSLEDYFIKQKTKEIDAAILYAQQWFSFYGKWPTVDEMTDAFAWLYLPHDEDSIKKYPQLFKPGGVDRDKYIGRFINSSSMFDSFDSFIEECERCERK